MKRDTPLFASGSLIVTPEYIRTPRETIGLDDIDMVSVRRPLLFVLLPGAVLLAGLWLVFQIDLYAAESIILLGLAGMFAGLALGVGELKVHSLSLRDESVFGPIWRLRRARDAVENSVFSNEQTQDHISRTRRTNQKHYEFPRE